MSDTAREHVLGRIRAATRDVRDPPPTARSEHGSRPSTPGDVAVFAERVADYRATVTRVPADSEAAITTAVAEILGRHGARRILAPGGLPDAWLPPDADPVHDDPPLDHAAIAGADGVLTGCALAIAETGTIVLAGGPRQGRRALTLLVDLHVCVVHAEQILATVPDAVAALSAERRPITFISGPSATSDIELDRVEGVHGPRRLEVIVTG